MRLCSRHSHEVMDELKKRGLWRLVKPERAKIFGARWLRGELQSEKEFDPYVVAWLEFNAKAKEFLNPEVWRAEHLCCLCQVDQARSRIDAGPVSQMWIPAICDLVHQLAICLRLIANESR